MAAYEYKVIPAPTKGVKAPGLKTAEARFANAIEQRMNELAADGWSYLRSDLLPSEERQGLTSSHTVYRSVLVFHRALDQSNAPLEADSPVEQPERAAPDEDPDLSEPPETADTLKDQADAQAASQDAPDAVADKEPSPR